MNPAAIENSTRRIGPPAGWDVATHGACGSIHVRDVTHACVPFMETAWEPQADELARLNTGAKVILGIAGNNHPVVSVWVGETPASPEDGLPLSSYNMSVQHAPDGSTWLCCVAHYGTHSFPCSICLKDNQSVAAIPLPEGSARIISAVHAHAVQQGWTT